MDPTLESLLALEGELQFSKFDSAAAWKLGTWLADKARKEGLKIAVSVTKGGQRLFHWAADGTNPDNDEWLDRKNRTVYRFGHSTFYLRTKLEQEHISGEDKYYVSEREYCFHGGAFPIVVKGTGVVGTVAVSGLKQDKDHELTVAAIRHVLKK